MKDPKGKYKLVLFYLAITICLVAIILLLVSLMIHGVHTGLDAFKIVMLVLNFLAVALLFTLIMRTDLKIRKAKYYEDNFIETAKIIDGSVSVNHGNLVKCDVWGQTKTLCIHSERCGEDGIYRDNQYGVLNSIELAALRWFLECEPHNDISVRAATINYLTKTAKENKFNLTANFELSDLDLTDITILFRAGKEPTIIVSGECKKCKVRTAAIAFYKLKLLGVGKMNDFLK